MSVNLQSTPIVNTTPLRITLNDAHGNILATLDPDSQDPKVLTLTFFSLSLYNPPAAPVMRNQAAPAALVTVHPGNVAFLDNAIGGGITLTYGRLGQQPNNVNF